MAFPRAPVGAKHSIGSNNYILFVCRSDEENCSTVVFPEYEYTNDLPPNRRVLETFNLSFPPLEIETKFTINKIFNINDDNSAFSTIFQVELEWNDLNLKFNYLKKSKRINIISQEEWKKIWKPDLSFATLTGTAVSPKILDEELLVRRNSKAYITDNNETLFHNETYSGATNSIYFRRIYQGEFVCQFDGVSKYPVGTNLCYFRMYLRGIANAMTKLNLLPLHVNAPNKIGEFYVERYFLQEIPRHELNTVSVSFELSRSRASIILVTYLPTILMNMINQVLILDEILNT